MTDLRRGGGAVETKKWEAMLTAVELGSFTRAAQRLGLTQSGLTHMMNSLEKEVGFPLLLRDRYGVRLTAAGESLLPAARELLQAGRRLDSAIAAQTSLKRENIRVAAYSSICMHWLPTIVQQFRWDFPDVSVDIRMGSVDEMYRWLQEGKVDLSFASRQDRGQYSWVPLWDDPLLAILPVDYPVESGSRFPVSGFDGKEFLMPSLGFDQDILSVFEAHGVHPAIIALKWALQRGQIPIPFSIHNYTANLECTMTEPLTEEEMRTIGTLERHNRLVKGQVFLWPGAKDWHDLWDEDGIIVDCPDQKKN